MKKLTLLAMLLVDCITMSAQTNPKPGYIITNDKGTYEVYDKFFALWMKEYVNV